MFLYQQHTQTTAAILNSYHPHPWRIPGIPGPSPLSSHPSSQRPKESVCLLQNPPQRWGSKDLNRHSQSSPKTESMPSLLISACSHRDVPFIYSQQTGFLCCCPHLWPTAQAKTPRTWFISSPTSSIQSTRKCVLCASKYILGVLSTSCLLCGCQLLQ